MYPPHDLGGGYEITWRSWVSYARERGDSVRVLTTDWRRAELGPDTELDPDVHRELRWYWRDHEFPKVSIRERIRLERHNAAVLERHLGQLQPDAVAWWGMGGMSLSLVERVRRAGLPAVGVVGDEWLRWGPRVDAWTRPFRGRGKLLAGVAERLTRLPARVELDTAAVWIFNSEAVREKALAANPKLARTTVAHPGIDAQLFGTPAPEESWQWRLLYVGRIDPRKGVHLAVETLPHLPAAATLRILGTGDDSYVTELRTLAESLGVRERVTFSEARREEIPGVYAAADAVLFPVQWEEPWGLVPLEAMGVGRPVVASGTGGSREYLRDGRNCLIFAPRDSPLALAEAIKRLGSSAQIRSHLREEGLKTAARFSETSYNEAIGSTLQRVAGERH